MSLDNASMTIYGDSISGNCLKVKFVADRLGLAYDWVEISVLAKETRTPEFLALNPAGQVPLVVFAGNGPLAQSNAIILHLAENSDLIPADPFDRTVDMLISRLRKKLDSASPGSNLINTVRNGGYLFTAHVSPLT